MKEYAIAGRYARSLLKVAREKNTLELFGEQLARFAQVVAENESLRFNLERISVDLGARERVVRSLQEKMALDALIGNFLCLLVRKGRISHLAEIAAEYTRQLNEVSNRQNMTVSSTTPLSDEQYAKLSSYFSTKTGRTMILRKKIEPSLIGGVRVQVGDNVYDYSLKNQLEQLRSRMLGEQ